MSATTAETFLVVLEKSRLFSPAHLAQARALPGPDPQALAQRLIQAGKLTRWQAQQLLAGRHSFFLGKYEVTQREYEQVMGTNPSRFKEQGLRAPVESGLANYTPHAGATVNCPHRPRAGTGLVGETKPWTTGTGPAGETAQVRRVGNSARVCYNTWRWAATFSNRVIRGGSWINPAWNGRFETGTKRRTATTTWASALL